MKAEFRRGQWQSHPTSVPKSLLAEFKHLAALNVQGADVQLKQSWLFLPCCLPSPPPHRLTKEVVVDGLENPGHTSVYASRGFLYTSEGICSQNVEGSSLSDTKRIFLGRNWGGRTENVAGVPRPRGLRHSRFTWETKKHFWVKS